MGEGQTSSKRSLKPIIIAVSLVLAMAAAFFLISSFIGSDKSSSEASAQMGDALANEAGGSVEKITTVQTANAAAANEKGETSTTKAYVNKIEEVEKMTNRKNNTSSSKDVILPKGSKSTLISGLTATKRWTASSVISKVVAEEIQAPLNVYDENGVKTSETKTRSLYVAVIDTKPSRVCIPAASQYTSTCVASMGSIVKGYGKKTGQDILFASSNEMCARDYYNPNGKIFYNGDDTLSATVIKDGKIAQRDVASPKSLIIYNNGNWEFPKSVSLSSSADLIKRGAIASVSYTYPVIWEGKRYNHYDTGENTGIWTDHAIGETECRTLIGKINNNKYVVVMSDGFGYGYLAEYMLNDLGVNYAYWGNGSVAAGMYIKGYGVITPYNYVVHGDLFCVK